MRSMKDVPVDEVVEKHGVAKAIGIKHVASLLFTYRCTIACKHCLFNCSPAQPPVRTTLGDGLNFFRQLRGTDRVVHVAGGEAIIYYDELVTMWRAAQEMGIAPHFFETNASWCVTDEITRKRYGELRQAGAKGVLISCDPYHLAHVPPSSFQRARRIALEVFGRENVITSDASPADLTRMVGIGRSDELLGEYTRGHPPRLVGRAGQELAGYLPERPIGDLEHDELWHPSPSRDGSCRSEFDPDEMWEVHIDPYGNVQTCCGIIIGNAHETSLPDLMGNGFNSNELVNVVREEGPFGLLKLAVELGFQPRDGYPQKCNLCWEVRKFLRPHFPGVLGPDEIYGRSG